MRALEGSGGVCELSAPVKVATGLKCAGSVLERLLGDEAPWRERRDEEQYDQNEAHRAGKLSVPEPDSVVARKGEIISKGSGLARAAGARPCSST